MPRKRMAVDTKEKPKPIAEVRKENEKLLAENEKLREGGWCYLCGKHKKKDDFYISTDPRCQSGITPICKECAKAIAERKDQYGNFHEPTKESVQEALRYLDKPFIESLWDDSVQESKNLESGRVKYTPWRSYVKNIAMMQYVGMTFRDSDMFKVHIKYDDEKTDKELVEEHSGMDTYDSYLKNKRDVVRLLDYDPFEKEPVSDQPFLYSQLLGMLDASEDANEDMMRVSSAIQIVRGFLQLQKIDDTIAKLMGNVNQLQDNSATIKSLQDSKQKVTSMITNLAAESCLSLKNSKSRTKGEDTFTGRLRKLRDLNLRDSELNGFSIETSKGMQQVADISMKAIISGLHFSEDEMSDIVAKQRQMIGDLNLKTKSYKEAVRLLLKENLDLRDDLDHCGMLKDGLINLDDLVRTIIPKEGDDDNATV